MAGEGELSQAIAEELAAIMRVADSVVEVAAPEAEVPEAEVPEAEVPEAEVPEAEVPEAEVPEAEVPEAEVPEAEVPEAEGAVVLSESLEVDVVLGTQAMAVVESSTAIESVDAEWEESVVEGPAELKEGILTRWTKIVVSWVKKFFKWRW